MARHSADGPVLLASLRGAVAELEARVEEINALNVYPVPDGDTGSNMLATVRSALGEAETVDAEEADRVAAAISFGALMGARGNSGVITSQIFRGIADGLAGKRRFNGLDFAHALTVGTQMAYSAVGKPVEGTILTVIKDASTGAVAAAERDPDLETVLVAAIEAGEAALARTPSLLAILRESGVVDAGGAGLLCLLRGMLGQLREAGEAPTRALRSTEAAAPRPSTLVPHADTGFGYEAMYLVQAAHGASLDLDAIRERLHELGESVLVAGDARAAKIHVHTERPDVAIGYGLSLGHLSRISVENLDHQAQDVRERRAAEFAGDGERPSAPTVGAAQGVGTEVAVASLAPAVVVVADGEGLAAVFASFGVEAVVTGGQGANPSTGELLAAIEPLASEHVLLLPNNRNVILAARQVADLSTHRVHVVPTRNAAEGVAALLALDPNAPAAENASAMGDAGRELRTLQVTEAVRDAKIGERRVKKGQTIVLDPDEGLVACASERDPAILEGLGALEPGFELVTLYYGDGADLAEAEHVSRLITGWRPGLEVELVHGGQPHYRYLIAAE